MRHFHSSVLSLILAVGLYGCGAADEPPAAGGSAGDAAVSVATDAQRIAEKSADNAGAAASAAGDAASAAIDLAAGEANYARFCFSCHAAGVAGAPKLGDADAWGPRVAKGLDALVASTIEGIPPGMPARGLCMNCSDADLRNTVAWMIAQ